MPTSVLNHRSMLRLGGADRIPFLQGLISNDMALCTPEQSLYAALLTPQGKFLHDMFIYHAGEEFLIDCEAARADDLVQRLSTYKLRAKVEIENIADQFDVIVIFNEAEPAGSLPLAGRVKKGGVTLGPLSQNNEHSQSSSPLPSPPHKGEGIYSSLDPRLPALGLRGYAKKGKTSGDDKLYDHHRLTLGIPDGSRDLIVGKSTLSDGNIDLLNGISWTKGCYVGQELTARMHHRALVKKRMFPVKSLAALPASGCIIQFNGAEIGEMRSSQKDVGLALLNIEMTQRAISKNAVLSCQGVAVFPSQRDWLKI